MSSEFTLGPDAAHLHEFYQWAVQDPEYEIDFTLEQFRRRRGREPRLLREDFCGTALVACRWVERHDAHRAIGLDVDGATLDWGRRHNVERLNGASDRVDLRREDVRTITSPGADVVQALNFSWYLLQTRVELVRYFRAVRESLAPGGIFMLDCFGGWEHQQTYRDRHTIDVPQGTFGFEWEQVDYNPITNLSRCCIHFAFRDGERMDNAFEYDLRIYSPSEVRDALESAGFSHIEFFSDHAEDDSYSDYRPVEKIEPDDAWVLYVIADG